MQGGGAWPRPADISTHVFAGRRDITDPDHGPARLLCVGPGALSTALTLAGSLAAEGATAAYVFCADDDPVSRDGLRPQADQHGVGLIDAGNVEDEPPFDFIEAGAAVATAADPAITLTRVKDWLTAGGGIGLCVPGAVGLVAMSYVRDAIGMLAPEPSSDEGKRLALLRRLLADLAPTNWLTRATIAPREAGKWAASQRLFRASAPRLFSVADLIALGEAVGMRVSALVPDAAYDPLLHLRNPQLRERVGRLDPPQRWIVAELLRGGPWTHHCFLLPGKTARTAAPSKPAAIGDIVRRQYEAYPYPARDPADDRKGEPVGSPSNIAEVDHYVCGGRRDWHRPLPAR